MTTNQPHAWNRAAAVAALALSVAAWLMAGVFMSQSFGDVFVDDPIERARVIDSRDFWSHFALVAMFFGFFASSALAGYAVVEDRALAVAALLLNMGFIVVVVVFIGAP